MLKFSKKSLPSPGLGLGLRRSISQQTLEYVHQNPSGLIQWLEIVPENYISLGGVKAKQLDDILQTGVKLIPHGVNLSIGTAPLYPGKPEYDPFLIKEMRELFAQINPPWFSDHLSCTRINGYYTQDLIPIPHTRETVDIVSDNVKFLQDEFQIPFLIENPSFYTTIIESEITEVEFINSILQQADCGMLLDVNNVYVNAVNHGKYTPIEFLDGLNLDRVVQVHIAGHLEGFSSRQGHFVKILDTHGETIKEEVYIILKELLKRTHINAILLERDSNFPDFDDLLSELTHIQKIQNRFTKLQTNL